MLRTVRRGIEVGLPIAGTIVVFAAILLLIDPVAQIAVAAIGVLMIQAGIWKLTQPILPSERRFQALRREVDEFIALVRRMNAAALTVKEADSPETRALFQETRDRMRESLERMAELAGKTDEEVAQLTAAGAAGPDPVLK